jgi:hypothetical protein
MASTAYAIDGGTDVSGSTDTYVAATREGG